MKTAFISGHLDLTEDEFIKHYVPAIDKAILADCSFVVGDARGADAIAQQYLMDMAKEGHLAADKITVYHAYKQPRHNFGFEAVGGFESQTAKDAAMTKASHFDIAWVRPGRESSGTARNIERRKRYA